MVEKTGLKAALSSCVDTSAPVPGSAAVVQPSLPLPLRQVAQDEPDAEPDPAARGAGRPKGSKNKSTQEWRDYLLSRYSSPVVALMETYSRTVAELARDLGYTFEALSFAQRLELFKIQLQCAKEAAPYVHQKQPMAIDGTGAGLINLILQSGAATPQQVEEAGVMPFHFVDAETVEDQQLIGQQDGKLDSGKSDAGNQDTETKQQTRE